MSAKPWNTVAREPTPVRGMVPSTRTEPESGVRTPSNIAGSVLFPQPNGPMRERNSPSCASKLTRLMMVFSP